MPMYNMHTNQFEYGIKERIGFGCTALILLLMFLTILHPTFTLLRTLLFSIIYTFGTAGVLYVTFHFFYIAIKGHDKP